MPSNDYKKILEPLRSREVQPPFEDIRMMVLQEKRSRRFLPIPFWLYLSASAPLVIAASILLFPELFGLQRVTRQSSLASGDPRITANAERGQSSKSTNSNSVESNPQFTNHEPRFANHDSRTTIHKSRITNHESRTTTTDPQSTIDHRQSTIDSPNPTIDDRRSTIDAPVAQGMPLKSAEAAAPPVHSVTELADNSTENHRLSLFIAAGLPTAQAPLPFADILYGSAGIKYRLNQVSSLSLEVRRNAFVRKYDAKHVTFHDTTLTAGNQTFHNTIGVLSSFPVQSANDVISIGLGYRLAFMESGRFIPFAEVMLGAASEGGLISEAAGIRYSFGSPFSFDLGLRSDELFSRGSSPLAALNVNAALEFTW